MGASQVSICSNASLMLGGHPINAMDEPTDRARLASNIWPQLRDYVLRAHPWNCAVKRVALPPETTAPAFDWDYQFTLPADYMRALSVGEAGAEVDFKIESGKLLCNQNPALLRYIWRNDEPTTWDDMLVWAMTNAMRAAMAYPTTQSASLSQTVNDALREVLKRARTVDGQDQTPDGLDYSPLMAARLGSGW